MDIERLLSRRLEGVATDVENCLITDWAKQAPENQAVLDRLESESTLREDLTTLFQLVDTTAGEARIYRMKSHIQQKINTANRSTYRMSRFTWRPYAAAAVALIILALGAYYYQHQLTLKPRQQGQRFTDGIHPGSNRATLTLANGQTVNLSEAQAGIIVGDGISYLDGSAVLNEPANELKNETIDQLMLNTPKGGTYQLTLPDGTKVWLNAASTLKYPSRFNGKERIVELEGEAYFEVSKEWSIRDRSKMIPFFVRTNSQTVQVLGTQFNISAYPDESAVKTTLVEGKVLVAPTIDHWTPTTIKPSEQATTHGAAIDISTVDTKQYTAWKDGRFHFKRTPLEEVMRQVSRWYDVDVIYSNGIPNETFTGKVSRSASLAELLDILRLSAIDVTLENNQLIVK
ncbi:FecR family protein [Olivibacter domesticus]|uniref:FecR family protein n=2 Tax=Olivibacter domesticus TaxID=407022 RepID=A0A1H7GDH3_OLID1|nr:FecR family protein [Olivibacter domesticus]SEK36199.1 FecR family protein [Olivibacter domesticus]